MTCSTAGPVAGYEPVTPVVEGEVVTERRRVIYFDTATAVWLGRI